MYTHNTFAPESNINSQVGEEGISIHCCYAGYGK